MIIFGNIVGNLAPNANWNQDDPTKADYIIGKGAVDQAIEDVAQETKNYADSLHFTRTTVVPAAGWSSSAPYTQNISISGITKNDTPHYGVVYSEDNALAEKEAFALIDDLDTKDGSVTFTCFEEKPAIDLIVQLEVNR